MELFPFDDDYLDKLRKGDSATEKHFVAYFEQLLRAKLRARMLPPDIVTDLCQETFYRVLVALRKQGGIREPERFGPFVNSICNHVLLEKQRQNYRVRPMEDDHFEIPSKAPNQETQYYEEEKCALVRRILKEIPARDQQILRDLFLNEVDKDEICKKYAVKRDYLRVLVHRAKDRFRVIYKKDQGLRPEGKRGL